VVKPRTPRERQSTRSAELVQQVLAAWIVAFFAVGVGLSLLALHERDGRNDGIASVLPRWYAPPVAGTEDWNEISCGTGIPSCPSELAGADDGADLKIRRSEGDSASWRSFSNPGRAQEPSRC